jgi:hypothetical protein
MENGARRADVANYARNWGKSEMRTDAPKEASCKPMGGKELGGNNLAQFAPDICGTYWLAAPSPKLLKKQRVAFVL